MEWITAIRKSLDYIESHLLDDISAQDVANEVYLSSVHFQKGFQIMTGYSVTEYIRNRRLYEAGVVLRDSDKKVIDVAMDYLYETPESFTKAFTRFHGVTPTAVKQGGVFRSFLPLSIKIEVQGGDKMDYKIKDLFGIKLIGFKKEFSYENANEEIPKFWDELIEKNLIDDIIGEYGVCIDDEALAGEGKLIYLVAGKYSGGDVPEGMMVYEFPQGEWAIFDCVGPVPGAIQSLNKRIFKEWLPGNPDYEINGNANIEWYDKSNPERSAVWIPVKKK